MLLKKNKVSQNHFYFQLLFGFLSCCCVSSCIESGLNGFQTGVPADTRCIVAEIGSLTPGCTSPELARLTELKASSPLPPGCRRFGCFSSNTSTQEIECGGNSILKCAECNSEGQFFMAKTDNSICTSLSTYTDFSCKKYFDWYASEGGNSYCQKNPSSDLCGEPNCLESDCWFRQISLTGGNAEINIGAIFFSETSCKDPSQKGKGSGVLIGTPKELCEAAADASAANKMPAPCGCQSDDCKECLPGFAYLSSIKQCVPLVNHCDGTFDSTVLGGCASGHCVDTTANSGLCTKPDNCDAYVPFSNLTLCASAVSYTI